MTLIQQWLAGLGVLAVLVFGSVQYGKHLTQVEWDKDIAARQSRVDAVAKLNKEALHALKSEAEKDRRATESKAGRDVAAAYLRGMLSPSCGGVPAPSAERVNGAAVESGAGSPLEKFTLGCGQDALKVMRWQELCIRMNCEIADQ